MNFETNSLGITSGILMTMSKIPALLQKVLAQWLRLPEKQELFPGLPMSKVYAFMGLVPYDVMGYLWDLVEKI